MKPLYRLVILLLALMTACKAPRPKYLVKDGGNWDITSMEYHVSGTFTIDTTFSNAGEVHFDMRRNDEEDFDDWMLEGYMVSPEYSILDNLPVFLTTTKWFKANTRTGLMLGNNIGFWDFQLEDWEVVERRRNSMQWTYVSWEGDQSITYNLERR